MAVNAEPDPVRSSAVPIRRYLLSRVIGILLVTFAVVVVAAWFILIRPSQDALARVHIDLATNQVEGEFRITAGQAEQFLTVLRDWTRTATIDVDDPAELVRIAISQLRNRPFLLNILFARPDGVAIIVGKEGAGYLLRSIDARDGGRPQRWRRYDADGRLTGEEAAVRDYDARERPWFQGAVAGGEGAIYWTDPYIFFETRDLGLTIATVAREGADGRPWVVGLDFTLRDVSLMTMQHRLGSSGGIAVLTPGGRVLALPREPGATPGTVDAARLMKRPEEIGLESVAQAWAAWTAAGNAEAVQFFAVKGEEWIGRFRPLRLHNLSLLVVAVAQRGDFAIGSRWDVAAMAGLMLAVLALGCLLARQMSTRFSGVLQAMVDESERIGAMRLDAPVYVPTRIREIGALVSAQERMRVLLREATQGLEQKVAARTRELAERQTLLSALLESSPSGLVLNTFSGQVRHVNARLTEIIGYSQAELHGQPVSAFYGSPDDRARFLEQIARDGEVRNFETRMVRKDGAGVWVLINSSVVTVGDERLYASWLHDITELHDAAARLGDALERQNAIFGASPHGIALFVDRRLVMASPSFERMFGHDAGTAIGEDARELFLSEQDFADVRRVVEAAAAVGETYTYEMRMRRRDGSPFWCRVTGASLGGPDPMSRLMSLYQDVTAEHEAAQALYEAKHAAEAATRAKSMFLANMSHEIRTPMNAIIGMSHLALRTALDHRQRDYVQKIHDAGTSLLGIVNDILDFSKIEAGRLDVEAIPFRLDDLLQRVVAMVEQRAHDKGLELVFDVAPDLPQALVGDPLRLSQVLTNLISNAVKFTERGQIAVTLRGSDRAGGTLRLDVEVRDTGIGMTPDQAGQLFQAFRQADGSMTRKYGGTGLGLAISKRLIELMGGGIRVASVPGVGTTFAFDVRLALGDEAATPRRVLPEALVGQRALVVDDNAAAREILSDMLLRLGFAVHAVASGRAALEAVATAASDHPFGIALLDWKMPGLDGLETARRLRALPVRPRMIMVSAFGRDEVREDAVAAGIEAFLVKPVSRSSLVDALIGVFAPERGEAARAAVAVADADVLRGVRLLVAEDNEINQQIARELLEGAGAEVDIAVTGRDAVAKVMAGGPFAYDAVLVDLQMPEMDGIEATARIRADARFADLPIIAMTAHAMVEERERCLRAGMVDHIAKPIDPGILFATLTRWVRPAARVSGEGTDPAVPPDAVPIPAIAGLDTVQGLRRVAGNRRLYRDLLRQFGDGQADAARRIAAAVASGDRAQAERDAHTVKGVAGNIGLDGLAAAAGALERAVAAGPPPPALLDDFAATLARVVEALDAALGQDDTGEPALVAAPGDALVAADAARLADLLAASDGEALDVLTERSASIRALFAGDGFVRFARTVDSFDFDAALEQLRRAAADRGVPLEETTR